jgi:hypothetical protein
MWLQHQRAGALNLLKRGQARRSNPFFHCNSQGSLGSIAKKLNDRTPEDDAHKVHEAHQYPRQLRHMAEEVVVMVELNRDCIGVIFSSRALAVGLGAAPVKFFG